MQKTFVPDAFLALIPLGLPYAIVIFLKSFVLPRDFLSRIPIQVQRTQVAGPVGADA
jgi:hypothetical protein